MRKTMIAAMIGLTAATPAQAERFAITCTGNLVMLVTMNGQTNEVARRTEDNIVYVIDTDARTISAYGPVAIIDRETRTIRDEWGELDKICSPQMRCSGDFSTDRVRRNGVLDKMGSVIGESFDLDRRNGTLVRSNRVSDSNVTTATTRSGKCVSAAIPTV